jgi:hypothetical protein
MAAHPGATFGLASALLARVLTARNATVTLGGSRRGFDL